MVGCFIESSLAMTAAAALAPFVDILDLDGAALLADDPFVDSRFRAATSISQLESGSESIAFHDGHLRCPTSRLTCSTSMARTTRPLCPRVVVACNIEFKTASSVASTQASK